MNMPPIVSPHEWEAAREELLVKEKELTREERDARIREGFVDRDKTARDIRQ